MVINIMNTSSQFMDQFHIIIMNSRKNATHKPSKSRRSNMNT
uniref:Uncharacterized protein n=1 Tax=Arundo donax TaxID=35708 RepID=A0A0A9A823_ARUDO